MRGEVDLCEYEEEGGDGDGEGGRGEVDWYEYEEEGGDGDGEVWEEK